MKPCPFCTTDDVGGACCFCDYKGIVTIGYGGMFSSIEQYNKVYFASSHQDRLDELHGRKSNIIRLEL